MSTLTSHLMTRDPARAAVGQFIDPFGHCCAVDQHLRDVPPDEVARLAAEAFAPGQEG